MSPVTEEYYNNYNSGSRHLALQYDILSGNPDYLPGTLAEPLQGREQAHYLVLGSATPRNIDTMALLDGLLRPGQGDKDTVTILDSNLYAVALHQKSIEELGEWQRNALLTADSPPLLYPHFTVKEADMRDTGLASESIDAVISDYTLNFLPDTNSVSAAFAEVSRVLKRDGAFLLAICGHSEFPGIDPVAAPVPPQVRELVGATIYKFPLGTYLELASKQGLELTTPPFLMGNDISCGVLQQSTYFG